MIGSQARAYNQPKHRTAAHALQACKHGIRCAVYKPLPYFRLHVFGLNLLVARANHLRQLHRLGVVHNQRHHPTLGARQDGTLQQRPVAIEKHLAVVKRPLPAQRAIAFVGNVFVGKCGTVCHTRTNS